MSRGHRSKSGNRAGRQGKRSEKGRLSPVNGVDFRGASKAGCSSGKWAWTDTDGGRERARSLKRALRKQGDGEGVREYLCPECDRWHVGHLPRAVLAGETSVAEWYASKRGRRRADAE